MSKTVKKKWSVKKKILLGVLCAVLFLLLAAVAAGLIVLNQYCTPAEYQVVSVGEDTAAMLIAHRGFRAVAPENTTASFEEAGKAGYWGAECDVYRTADGVWVVSHDISTYRMMDVSAFVEKKTYEELLTYRVDNGNHIEDYPDLTICSLEEYLEICETYGMTAVIELKGKNNTEFYSEITDLVSQFQVEETYISFHIENLQKIRELSDAPLWYLTQAITEEDIEAALALGGDCGIDFNGNKEKNTPQVIQNCLDKGLTVGAWTIDDTEVMQNLLDAGVLYITTDCITY